MLMVAPLPTTRLPYDPGVITVFPPPGTLTSAPPQVGAVNAPQTSVGSLLTSGSETLSSGGLRTTAPGPSFSRFERDPAMLVSSPTFTRSPDTETLLPTQGVAKFVPWQLRRPKRTCPPGRLAPTLPMMTASLLNLIFVLTSQA